MIHIENEEAMKEFGQRLGSLARGGDVFELVGDVGTGKTTLVKGLARGLEIDEDIQSPSFTINRTYISLGGLELSHYDFYRLQDPGIMASELREVTQSKSSVTVIEWADIVKDVLPVERLTIYIVATADEGRTLELRAVGARAAELAGELA